MLKVIADWPQHPTRKDPKRSKTH